MHKGLHMGKKGSKTFRKKLYKNIFSTTWYENHFSKHKRPKYMGKVINLGILKLKLLIKRNHKVKMQNHRSEEILLFLHGTNKKLVSRIYIELLQVNKRQKKN